MLRNTDITDPEMFFQGYRDGRYTRLNVADCLAAYSGDFVSSYRNLIAITLPEPQARLSPGILFPTDLVNLTQYYDVENYRTYTYTGQSTFGYIEPLANGSSLLALQGSGSWGTASGSWICRGWAERDQYASELDCSSSGTQILLKETGFWKISTGHGEPYLSDWSAQAYPIDHCYAETQGVETCQLQYVSYIFIIVIVCNVIKAIAMGFTTKYIWNLEEPILATVGDAMDSFLGDPDSSTRGHSLMSFHSIKIWTSLDNDSPAGAVYNRAPTARIYSSTTKTRWWTTMLLCFLYLLIGLTMLVLSLTDATGVASQSIWTYTGLGAVKQYNSLGLQRSDSTYFKTDEADLLASVLVANSFQLVLSITYFLSNSLWTAQCAGKEWSTYATTKKPLRVTWPRGQQRSTYYLSLPYKYGIPLIGCLAILHFFISQAIYLARVQFYNADGTLDEGEYISDAACSPLGILCTVVIASVLLISMVVHSLSKCSNIIPPHSNCSAVISAMCHHEPDSDIPKSQAIPIIEKSLQWGVVPKTSLRVLKLDIHPSILCLQRRRRRTARSWEHVFLNSCITSSNILVHHSILLCSS